MTERDVPPLSLDEAQRIIAQIEEVVATSRVILIGGQAVAIWVAQLAERIGVISLEQVASGDIDFQGGHAEVQRAAELLGGTATLAGLADLPMAGMATFVDTEEHTRVLDFLAQPFGLDHDDVIKTAIPLRIETEGRSLRIWVMHPERSLESRVHNSELPNKQTPLAYRQLRASVACARAFSELILDDLGEAGVRPVLRLNERIFAFALRNRRARKLAVERKIETFEAVLVDDRLPEAFHTIRLPQMRERIEARRARDRELYARRSLPE